MVWHILQWVTTACMGALVVFGFRMATGPEAQARPGARKEGTLLILCSLPGLGIRLPALLGWPRSIRLAFEIPSLLLLVATGSFLALRLKERHRSRQQGLRKTAP